MKIVSATSCQLALCDWCFTSAVNIVSVIVIVIVILWRRGAVTDFTYKLIAKQLHVLWSLLG